MEFMLSLEHYKKVYQLKIFKAVQYQRLLKQFSIVYIQKLSTHQYQILNISFLIQHLKPTVTIDEELQLQQSNSYYYRFDLIQKRKELVRMTTLCNHAFKPNKLTFSQYNEQEQLQQQTNSVFQQRSLFPPLLKVYVNSNKAQQVINNTLPLKFKGMIMAKLCNRNKARNLTIIQGFKIWHCKRNTIAVQNTVDAILTRNKLSPECFLYRLKSMCRKQLKIMGKQTKNDGNSGTTNTNANTKYINTIDISQQTDISLQNQMVICQLDGSHHFGFQKLCLQSKQLQQGLAGRYQINDQISSLKGCSDLKTDSIVKLEKLRNDIVRCQDRMIVLSVRFTNRLLLKMICKRLFIGFKRIQRD